MVFKLKNRVIGENAPVFIVGELSCNHLHDFDLAVKSIRAMGEAGADAVKLQTYTADTITIDCTNEYFRIKQGTMWDGRTLHELYREAYTPWDWQPKLKTIAEELGLIFFSSPFDKSAVDFLETMKIPIYKVASFEITDIPLIEYIASKGKPVILSTGIATLSEIEEAVRVCQKTGNNQIALLKCTSAYPAYPEEMNLSAIPWFSERFGTVVGLSDHSLGMTAPIVSVALGAKIIEKHFILDRNLGGPDAAFSLEPDAFKAMVVSVREAEKTLGSGDYDLSERQKKNRAFARSLFVIGDLIPGDTLTEENIRSIRPGYGMSPKHLKEVLGRAVVKKIDRGTPLNWEMIEGERK